jgi:hypothetical protein
VAPEAGTSSLFDVRRASARLMIVVAPAATYSVRHEAWQRRRAGGAVQIRSSTTSSSSSN